MPVARIEAKIVVFARSERKICFSGVSVAFASTASRSPRFSFSFVSEKTSGSSTLRRT